MIKTFEDACRALNLDAATVIPNMDAMPEKHRKALTAHAKLVIIAEAKNEGWQPDWSSWDERKYYPWFDITKDKKHPSGFGFAFNGWTGTYTYTTVGSRLVYKTAELAEEAGRDFVELYREYMMF